MKKMFSLFVATLVFANLIIAQTEPKTHKNKIQYLHAVEAKVGYNVFVDDYGVILYPSNQITIGDFHNCWGVGLQELHGIQFNPHLSLAAVIGVSFYKMYPDEESFRYVVPSYSLPYPDLYILNFTFGLNFKYTILKKYKWSPFLAAEICPIGVALQGLIPHDFNYAGWVRSSLFSISAGAHYRFKDRQSLYVSMGYEQPFSHIFLSVGVRLR